MDPFNNQPDNNPNQPMQPQAPAPAEAPVQPNVVPPQTNPVAPQPVESAFQASDLNTVEAPAQPLVQPQSPNPVEPISQPVAPPSADLQPSVEMNAPQQPESPKRGMKKIILLAVIGVVVAGLAIALFLFLS